MPARQSSAKSGSYRICSSLRFTAVLSSPFRPWGVARRGAALSDLMHSLCRARFSDYGLRPDEVVVAQDEKGAEAVDHETIQSTTERAFPEG